MGKVTDGYQLTAYVARDEYDRLKELAASSERSVAAEVRLAVREWLSLTEASRRESIEELTDAA